MGIGGPEAYLESTIEALDGGDAAAAGESIARIEAWIRDGRTGESLYPAMTRVWDRFVSLLRRRGFFTGSPEEMESSLEEILSLGRGFDLYDLAHALALCDEAASGSRKVLTSPFFPLLAPFSGNGSERSSSESSLEN